LQVIYAKSRKQRPEIPVEERRYEQTLPGSRQKIAEQVEMVIELNSECTITYLELEFLRITIGHDYHVDSSLSANRIGRGFFDSSLPTPPGIRNTYQCGSIVSLETTLRIRLNAYLLNFC